MLLILAFRGTVAEKVARTLTVPAKKIYLESNQEWLESFVDNTEFTEYDYILTMGEYSGRDKDAIRIETECSSRFRNSKANLQKLAIPYFFKPTSSFKLANGIGNSWCNLISHKILSKVPDAKFTFLHIPKDIDEKIVVQAMDRELDQYISKSVP